jgi:hypothetical protein
MLDNIAECDINSVNKAFESYTNHNNKRGGS